MKPEIYKMSWGEVKWRMDKHLPIGRKAFGVPRGGAIVAGIYGNPTSSIEDAEIIVDDIVDSGRTAAHYKSKAGLPFYALVDKTRQEDKDLGWVQFPWETSPSVDVEENVTRLLEVIGEDPKREGLRDTPKRVIKALHEMTSGYGLDPSHILKTDFAGEGYDEMVVCRNIEFTSLCEHHMLPFTGIAHVGYLPDARIVGLSKMARLVDCFSRRLQIQERLTRQIAEAMNTHLSPRGVGVQVVAHHGCMSCRGVMKHKAEMVTSTLLGAFREQPAARAEFFELCRSQS